MNTDLSDISFPLRRPNGAYLGMTTPQEQRWCREFAENRFRGDGARVELGPFIGSLTIPIAEGLQAAVASGRLPRERAFTESYDLYHWHHSMDGCIAGTPLEGRIQNGQWFHHIFQANTAHMAPYIHGHWADLCVEKWNGGPIELLLLDCLKYDKVTNNVLGQFFPALRSGLSRIAQQDYFHFYEWWTHLLTFEQRHLLEIEEEVAGSGMLILKVTGDFAPWCAGQDRCRDFSTTSPEAIEEAYEWNFRVIDPRNHDSLHAARIWAYICIGKPDTARRLYEENRARYGESYPFKDLTWYCQTDGHPF